MARFKALPPITTYEGKTIPRKDFMRSAQRADKFISIGPDTFRSIEEWIAAAESAGRNTRYGTNALVMLMARYNQAIAMQMSAGFNDPQGRNPQYAWRIPVRRITSRYYRGWKVKRLAPGAWILYNDTREAYFIEYGINHVGPGNTVTYKDGRTYIKSARRVRRPIRKLSLIKTLKYVDTTRTGDRVWEMIFGSFRPGREYRKRGDLLINEQVQASAGMVNI